ncbi:hypothetical protein TNCV_124531 [Trichonephila clavipes]|nr:hypothetical protein TNCV_124531 [Trichonephila clavipes]
MFCPLAAPVGLNSFYLLSLCRLRRSRHIPSLAPCAPMSGYTLYVFRRAVVTGSGSLCGRSFTTALSEQTPIPARGFNSTLQNRNPLSSTITPLYFHSLSTHPTPNHPLMFCPLAAPVGLNSFYLLSLCRPRRSGHIPSLAPCAPMSGYTLYVFRRAVVTGLG